MYISKKIINQLQTNKAKNPHLSLKAHPTQSFPCPHTPHTLSPHAQTPPDSGVKSGEERGARFRTPRPTAACWRRRSVDQPLLIKPSTGLADPVPDIPQELLFCHLRRPHWPPHTHPPSRFSPFPGKSQISHEHPNINPVSYNPSGKIKSKRISSHNNPDTFRGLPAECFIRPDCTEILPRKADWTAFRNKQNIHIINIVKIQ